MLLNGDAFESLPPDYQEMLRRAAGDEAGRMLAEMTFGNGQALKALTEDHGVTIRRFPDEVAGAMLRVSEQLVAEVADTDDISRRIYASWSAFRANMKALAPLTELGFLTYRAL